MNTIYHPEGNRDFRRYVETTVPQMGLLGASVAYGSQMGKIGGLDRGIAESLMRDSMAKDPRLKINVLNIDKAFRNIGFKAPFDINPFYASYDPKRHIVNTAPKNYGLLAHELGHAEQYKSPLYRKTIAPLSAVGRVAQKLGVLAPIFTDNEEEARRNSLIAGGLQVPTLIEEFDSSRRGSKILKKSMSKPALTKASSGGKLARVLTALRPFGGMPTYALGAAAPYLIYRYLKGRGLYEGEY
jgi:hypothetical protein